MGSDVLSSGQVIRGRCTVCKEVTPHTVLSFCRDKPGEVRCRHCSDEHRFKTPPPTREEKEKLAVEKMHRKKIAEDCERWSSLRPRMIEAKAKDYSMDGLFKKKDVVEHPVFGLGMVERNLGAHKVRILFEDGSKVMRCQ